MTVEHALRVSSTLIPDPVPATEPPEWTLLDYDERLDAGRRARQVTPRSAHAQWSPWHGRRDPIDVLETQADSRASELIPIRYGRMAESPFAFFRGGAAIMAMDLATTPTTGMDVQACGDAHVNNFGKFATPERNVAFDINDFDETLPGPWEWDLKRLAASMFVVARQNGLSRGRSRRITRTTVRTYRERMAAKAPLGTLERWYHHIRVDDVVAHFPDRYRAGIERDVRKAMRKGHDRAVARLTVETPSGRRFREDPPLQVHLDDTDATMDDVIPMIAEYRATLSEERRLLFDRFRLVDVARRVVGVGSVGTRCWVALFQGPDRPDGDFIVLQIKQAQASVLEPYAGASTYAHAGERVVVGQRLTQAASDMFLGWCTGPRTGRHYYVRQLWDVKGQSDVMVMDAANLEYYGALCGWALARAHARTGDAAQLTGYLGSADKVDRAVTEFAEAYAATNAEDHQCLLDAIASGRVEAVLPTR